MTICSHTDYLFSRSFILWPTSSKKVFRSTHRESGLLREMLDHRLTVICANQVLFCYCETSVHYWLTLIPTIRLLTVLFRRTRTLGVLRKGMNKHEKCFKTICTTLACLIILKDCDILLSYDKETV